MYCPNCGNEISDNASVCPECGRTISGAITGKTNQAAIAGFVLALVGSGLLGLIFSCVGLTRANRGSDCKGLAVAGVIIGILKLLVSLISVIVFFTIGISFLAALGEAIEQAEEAAIMLAF